jgi:hypothetical protein
LNVVLAGKRPIDLQIGHRLRAFREQRLLSLETRAGSAEITADQLAAHEAGERKALHVERMDCGGVAR